MGYPKNPKLKGLAAVTFHPDIPSWEFDIAATPPGEDCTEINDWHRRHGWGGKKTGHLAEAARALIDPAPLTDCNDSDLGAAYPTGRHRIPTRFDLRK